MQQNGIIATVKNGRRKRWLLPLLIVIFVLGLAAGGLLTEALLHRDAPAGQSEPPADAHKPGVDDRVTVDAAAQHNIRLSVARAEMRKVEETLQATGIVSPNESRLAHVRPLARGRIEKVRVRLGDPVRAGQTLLVYDNIELGDLIGQYLTANADLERANAEAQVARRSLERAKNLVELGAVAKAEFDRRDAEHQNALATVNSKKAEQAKIEEKLHRFGLTEAEIEKLNPKADAQFHREASWSELKAPFSGVIIRYKAAEGEAVGPEDELFTIADLSTVWVQADVYEKDIASMRVGQEARIVTSSYPGEVFRGKITNISDFLDPKTRTAKVRCEAPNPDGRLKLEMFATIQLPVPRGREALMVPEAAVQQIEDRPVVFVKTGPTEFRRRNVELGVRSGGWVEVANGLEPGEPVVTQGSFHLKSTLLRGQIGHEH